MNLRACLVTYFVIISDLYFTIYDICYFDTLLWYQYVLNIDTHIPAKVANMEIWSHLTRENNVLFIISWYIWYQKIKITNFKNIYNKQLNPEKILMISLKSSILWWFRSNMLVILLFKCKNRVSILPTFAGMHFH